MKFNVKCENCKKGNLHLPEGYDGLADYYQVHCTKCTNVFTTHYTGMDNILEAHDYNNSVCKDIQVLNANGSWVHRASRETKFKYSDFDFDTYTKGMKHIQTIEVYENKHYYRNGGNFILISHNSVHGTIEIFNYEAKEENLPTLMKHFFSVA